MGKKLTVKEIELDKNLKSLIKKGLVVKVKGGYTLSPLGMKLLGGKNGKPNKKGGKIKTYKKGWKAKGMKYHLLNLKDSIISVFLRNLGKRLKRNYAKLRGQLKTR